MDLSPDLGAAETLATISLRERPLSTGCSPNTETAVTHPLPTEEDHLDENAPSTGLQSRTRARVLVISQVPPPVHGSTLITQVLLEVLSESGVTARLADRRFSSEVSEIGKFSLRKLAAMFGLVARVWRSSSSADICIFFVTNRTGSFVVDCVLRAVLRLRRCPTIAYVHTLGFENLAQRSAIWDRMVRFLLGGTESVVCLSTTLTADVRPYISSDTRVETIGNTAPVAFEPTAHNGPIQFLYLSNYIAEKGIDDFLTVASRSNRELGARFIAAGAPTSAGQLAQLADRASPNTVLLGAVGGQRKADLFAQSTALVFPSTYRFEAQPLTILEALSAGLPVIAYDVGGISDVVRDGVNGFVVPAGDVDALQAAVRKVATDSSLRGQLGMQAAAAYRDNHSREAFKAAWAREIGVTIG